MYPVAHALDNLEELIFGHVFRVIRNNAGTLSVLPIGFQTLPLLAELVDHVELV